MTTTQDDFARQVMELAGEISEDFTPYVSYDPDGDCVHFFISPDPYYGERIDDLVTVYRSNEIIGSLIKDIKKIHATALHTAIVIIDGKIRLQHIFQSMIDSPQQKDGAKIVPIYQKLAEITKANDLDAELCVNN